METEKITSIDWQKLTETILDGKCVLFLGPGATVNYKDINRQKAFFESLVEKDTYDEIDSYHVGDGFLIFKDKGAITDVKSKLSTFYKEEDFSSEMLEKLVQIPFHLIVMLSPDLAFKQEMKKQHFAFDYNYFNTSNSEEVKLPTKDTLPLLYHLCGNGEELDSLIVSHKDEYDYMKSLLGGIKLPQNLKTVLSNYYVKYLIFLGIDFDKWYFELILNFLELDNLAINSRRKFAYIQEELEYPVRTIWEKNFQISFIPNQITDFVEKLYEIFKTQNKLRQPQKISVTANRKYNLANIYECLMLAFTSTELETLCLCHFEEVYNGFTSGQDEPQRINKLIEYVKKNNLFEQLISLMRKHNTPQFDKNAPYYHE